MFKNKKTKIFVTVLATVIFLLIIGALSNKALTFIQKDDIADNSPEGITTIYSNDDFGDVYRVDKLPCDIPVEDNSLSLLSIDMFQEESKNGYYGIGVVTIDFNNLTDKEIYWIEKDNSIKTALSITSDENALDSEWLDLICVLEEDNVRYYVFDLRNEQRYSLDGSKIYLHIDIDNERQYDAFVYSADIETMSDIDKMNPAIYEAMNDALLEELEF